MSDKAEPGAKVKEYFEGTQMKKLIISAERRNIKTGEYTTQDMVKAIRRIVEKNAE